MPDRERAPRLTAVLLATGLVLVVSGSAWWALGSHARAPGIDHRVLALPPVAVVPGEAFVPIAGPPRPAVAPAAPLRVEVPALGVDAPVVAVRARRGTLLPPSDPFRLGWWADGPRPGDVGAALVTGHTVHDGPGALNALGRLRVGDLVRVRTAVSVLTYRVAQVRTFSRGSLARHAQQLFSRAGPSRLALVTCSGWDGHRYLSNVVVTAALLQSHAGVRPG